MTSQLGRARAPGLGEVLASHTAGQQAQDPTTPISGGLGAKLEETPCLHPFSRWEDCGLVQLLRQSTLSSVVHSCQPFEKGEQRELCQGGSHSPAELGRLRVCCVTSLPQGPPTMLMTGQGEEEVVGWAALTQLRSHGPGALVGQTSAWVRQLPSRPSLPSP